MKQARVLPGFRLTFWFTTIYLSAVVLIPLGTLLFRATALAPAKWVQAILSPQSLAAFRLTFGASLLAALVNAVCGLLIAWVLVRYKFWGKSFLDALIDVPFALPTAVAGIALTAAFSDTGRVGKIFAKFGIQIAFARPGVLVALIFVGLPLVVRTIQPVLADLDPHLEESAATMGAGRWATFRRVHLPLVLPAVITGAALAFARALGEYGSVVFISGNLPMKTEIVPLLIVSKLEQYDYAGATALATVILLGSFVSLLAINALATRAGLRKRGG